MTRKDFDAIAGAFARTADADRSPARLWALESAANAIAAHCAAANPRFDRARFMQACNVATPTPTQYDIVRATLPHIGEETWVARRVADGKLFYPSYYREAVIAFVREEQQRQQAQPLGPPLTN